MNEKFMCKISRLRNETLCSVSKYGTEATTQLEDLWLKIYGDNDDIFIERYGTILEHIRNLYDEMIKEETQNYLTRKDTLLENIRLSKQLSEELSIEINLPNLNVDGNNIRKQIRDVQLALEGALKLKEERMLILNKYKEEEQELCDYLGELPSFNNFTSVPSEIKLKEIKSRIVLLNSEKVKRSKILKTVMTEINELVTDLEIENDLSYDRKSLLSDFSDIILSHEKLQEISDWKKELIELKDEQEKVVENLKEKTMTLWNRLDISGEERESVIIKTYKPFGKSVIKTWSDELARCEHLKLVNIKEVILRLREIIANLWDECHLDEEERNKFFEFYNDDFNEELLEAHEKEEEKLKSFYNGTRDLYKTAEKWFELWNKMAILESCSNNLQRLNNRGGQLLKEEKERKAVHKELPKIEGRIEKMIKKFEDAQKKPFLFDGVPLMSLIQQYHENRKAEKENEKEFRKVQQMSRSTPMKSQSRVAPSPMTGCSRGPSPIPPDIGIAKKIAIKRQLPMGEKSAKKDVRIRRRSKSQDPSMRKRDPPRLLRSNSSHSSDSSSSNSHSGYKNILQERSKTTLSAISSNSLPRKSPAHQVFFKTPTSDAKRRCISRIPTRY